MWSLSSVNAPDLETSGFVPHANQPFHLKIHVHEQEETLGGDVNPLRSMISVGCSFGRLVSWIVSHR